MKVGRSLSELAAELDRQARTKRDFLADTRAMTLVPTSDAANPVVLEGVNGGMPLRATAHQQMAVNLGIPKPYYDRMLANEPDLLCANVNRWLTKNPTKRLVRTLDGQVRALLSDSYRPLDNLDLAYAVLPTLSDLHANVVSAEITEYRFYLKAVTDEVTGEVKKGDRVRGGLVVSNSEIRHGKLRVEEFDERLICTNGMIGLEVISKRHVGGKAGGDMEVIEDSREYFRDETKAADDKAFFLKVRDVVAGMFDVEKFNLRLNKYRDAADRVIVADPIQVVELTAKKFGFSEEEKSSVLQHLIRSGSLDQWSLANAVTRTAEDVASYDRATELEAIGGDVVELSAKEWKALAV